MTAPDMDPAVIAAAAGVICDNVDDEPMWSAVVVARKTLEAVAPLIAAAALRDAAEKVYEAWPGGTGYEGMGVIWAEGWLESRADALAPVSKEDQP